MLVELRIAFRERESCHNAMTKTHGDASAASTQARATEVTAESLVAVIPTDAAGAATAATSAAASSTCTSLHNVGVVHTDG